MSAMMFFLADLVVFNGSSAAYDTPTSKGLRHKRKKIHIYSNSWGPLDNGYMVHRIGPRVQKSLEYGAKKVRIFFLVFQFCNKFLDGGGFKYNNLLINHHSFHEWYS
jgi:hypothetical protein